MFGLFVVICELVFINGSFIEILREFYLIVEVGRKFQILHLEEMMQRQQERISDYLVERRPN